MHLGSVLLFSSLLFFYLLARPVVLPKTGGHSLPQWAHLATFLNQSITQRVQDFLNDGFDVSRGEMSMFASWESEARCSLRVFYLSDKMLF